MSKYDLDNCRVFDTGNDAHITAAFVTDFYLDIA